MRERYPMIPQLRKFVLCLFFSIFCFSALPVSIASSAQIFAKVDISQQRMKVYVNGKQQYVWPVSTGKKGWRTPTGKFRPFSMHRNYYEKRWQANLPYLIGVTRGGVAIHGTYATKKLGRPASHGCIRLSVNNASRFYSLVKRHGLRNTRVVVTH